MIHPATQLIVGIHAGWRGVANRILPKSIARMHALGAPNQEVHVIIGPHIQKNSFEVNFDVRDSILTSIGHAAVADSDIFFENIYGTALLQWLLGTTLVCLCETWMIMRLWEKYRLQSQLTFHTNHFSIADCITLGRGFLVAGVAGFLFLRIDTILKPLVEKARPVLIVGGGGQKKVRITGPAKWVHIHEVDLAQVLLVELSAFTN